MIFNSTKLKNKVTIFTISLALVGSSIGCGLSNGVKGAAAGATGGAVIGGLIGNNNGSTTKGTILGAAIGGAAGTAIGVYMDKQEKEIEQDIEGAEIERVGEGIKITFDSGLLFPVGQSSLTTSTRASLNELATTLKKYDDTNILVEGHTDASGSEKLNQRLSKERASAVAQYLMSLGVNQNRMSTVGYGENQPIATNDTKQGMRENRRVEMAIFANEKLKKAAMDGEELATN